MPPLDADRVAEVESEPGFVERTEPALPRAILALEASGLKSANVREDGAARAAEHGLTASLAVDALEEIADACTDPDNLQCDRSPEGLEIKKTLVQWLGLSGDEGAGEVLMRLDSAGEYRAGMALDQVLERRAEAQATACTPPAAGVVAEVEASLTDFAVFDQRGSVLLARALTPSESADLAYFLVAVERAGTPVGTDDDSFESGSTPSETFNLDREANYTAFEQARTTGDTEAVIRSGVAYLEPLGFPGTIDRSLEGNHRWGGAQYSYVMRDVAVAAEVAGDYGLASSLYRRANPGGGACGTSVSSRRGDQLHGLIRAADAEGRCNDVVAERLLDWDGREGSYFGPDRLTDAGFDIERIYRGAFLTRNRDLPEMQLLGALGRAPATFAVAARARIESKGAEAWDARIWSIEGLADTLGKEGGFYLADALGVLAPDARRRAIEAIGEAGRRERVGPCEGFGSWGFGRGSSNWSRPVAVFGTTCELSYSDAEVAALYRALRPNMRSASVGVRLATVEAASSLAALTARGDIKKLHAKHRRAAKACKPDGQNHCYTQKNALSTTREALETLEKHRTELRTRTE